MEEKFSWLLRQLAKQVSFSYEAKGENEEVRFLKQTVSGEQNPFFKDFEKR